VVWLNAQHGNTQVAYCWTTATGRRWKVILRENAFSRDVADLRAVSAEEVEQAA